VARAPTRLKQLIYRSKTIPGIADALAEADCLSAAACRDRKALARLISETLVPREGPPIPGPSPADDLESALIEHGYLNARGLEWAHTIVGPLDRDV
jgi:hypothetical protein